MQANASLMREMVSERWLRQLLDVLEGKADAPEEPIDPSQAVNIDPRGRLRTARRHIRIQCAWRI